MSKKQKSLVENLTAAHLNALNKTVEAVEVQLTALKHTLASMGGEPAEAEEDEDEEQAAPASKKRKKATLAEELEAAKEDEEAEEAEEDKDEDEDEEDEDEEDGDAPTLADVNAALKKYAATNPKGRKGALKKLHSMGVKSTKELSPKQYAKMIALVSG
jgi:hypothetical protein